MLKNDFQIGDRVPPRPTAPTGSDMALLKDRKWETSYTKSVVDAVEKVLPFWAAQPGNAVHDAVQLLKQYHRDLHLPYEQRDKALAELKIQVRTVALLQAELKRRRHCMHTIRGAIKESDDASRGIEPQKQTYVACRHYPNAIHNYFSEQTACEFCMKDGK